jgi:hypothetical protein
MHLTEPALPHSERRRVAVSAGAFTKTIPTVRHAVTCNTKKGNMQITWGEPVLGESGLSLQTRMMLPETTLMGQALRATLALGSRFRARPSLAATSVLWRFSSRDDVYDILWAVVFGFATLNILGLAARRFEPNRRGLTFGETMAVLVVVLSLFLLGWELLNVFQILPIKLHG